MTEKQPSPQESLESEQSSSSAQGSSLPWWRAPERILAVSGAIALCLWGKLSEEWTAIVLTAALGAPITQAAMAVVKKLRGK